MCKVYSLQSTVDSELFTVNSTLSTVDCTVQYIIQLVKIIHLVLPVQITLTLSGVFCETDSVFLKSDTQE